jgi:hypothetical protein
MPRPSIGVWQTWAHHFGWLNSNQMIESFFNAFMIYFVVTDLIGSSPVF